MDLLTQIRSGSVERGTYLLDEPLFVTGAPDVINFNWSTIKVRPGAGYHALVFNEPEANLTIRNLKLDGNRKKQSYTDDREGVAYGTGAVDLSQYDGNLGLLRVAGVDNVLIDGIRIKNPVFDGVVVVNAANAIIRNGVGRGQGTPLSQGFFPQMFKWRPNRQFASMLYQNLRVINGNVSYSVQSQDPAQIGDDDRFWDNTKLTMDDVYSRNAFQQDFQNEGTEEVEGNRMRFFNFRRTEPHPGFKARANEKLLITNSRLVGWIRAGHFLAAAQDAEIRDSEVHQPPSGVYNPDELLDGFSRVINVKAFGTKNFARPIKGAIVTASSYNGMPLSGTGTV